MKERTIDIPTPSGAMETFVTHPAENRPFAVVLIYMDVWGVREELFDIARRVATVGYYCMVPDFYYRQGKIRNEFRNDRSQMISLERLDAHKQELVRAPLRQLSDAMVIEDTRSILHFIDRSEPIRPGSIGCIGFCMGGRHALCCAASFPDQVKATASLHGSHLVSDGETSPHRLAEKLQGELYCGFAERDRHAAPAVIDALNSGLSGCSVNYRYEIHKGADHGYALPDRDVYDKQAANRDWELIFAMLHRQIPPAR